MSFVVTVLSEQRFFESSCFILFRNRRKGEVPGEAQPRPVREVQVGYVGGERGATSQDDREAEADARRHGAPHPAQVRDMHSCTLGSTQNEPCTCGEICLNDPQLNKV